MGYAKWTGPVTTSAGEKLNPSNVAIDPKDRNHFLFSKGGEYRTYESKDGGKTVAKIESHADKSAFFVMIDSRGFFYTATQAGAFASQDAGVTWNPLHVWMDNRDGTRHDRVPHDYQRIVPDFRGDGVAIPSDQGLHIVDLSTMQNMGPEYEADVQPLKDGNSVFLLTSNDFGVSWNWTTAMPANLQASGLVLDPTSQNSLFGFTSSCLAHSIDQGLTWSACSTSTDLTGKFKKLIVKDSQVMFMMRNGAVPLRPTDGGLTWTELTSAAPLFKYGATLDASLSWSGNTLVLHGADHSAIGRGEYGMSVWKSCDDGNTWTDETGDLVTISPSGGVWYEKDFYLPTSGEGVTVKRNFECSSKSLLI